jgi:hypothetical protein
MDSKKLFSQIATVERRTQDKAWDRGKKRAIARPGAERPRRDVCPVGACVRGNEAFHLACASVIVLERTVSHLSLRKGSERLKSILC